MNAPTTQLSDVEIRAEVARQVGWDVGVNQVHISQIRPGDTVFHEGLVRTVCRRKIMQDSFMGVLLFGDSYRLGTRLVHQVAFRNR